LFVTLVVVVVVVVVHVAPLQLVWFVVSTFVCVPSGAVVVLVPVLLVLVLLHGTHTATPFTEPGHWPFGGGQDVGSLHGVPAALGAGVGADTGVVDAQVLPV
jgi:hypothetical protein